jgi:hypothetical protein
LTLSSITKRGKTAYWPSLKEPGKRRKKYDEKTLTMNAQGTPNSGSMRQAHSLPPPLSPPVAVPVPQRIVRNPPVLTRTTSNSTFSHATTAQHEQRAIPVNEWNALVGNIWSPTLSNSPDFEAVSQWWSPEKPHKSPSREPRVGSVAFPPITTTKHNNDIPGFSVDDFEWMTADDPLFLAYGTPTTPFNLPTPTPSTSFSTTSENLALLTLTDMQMELDNDASHEEAAEEEEDYSLPPPKERKIHSHGSVSTPTAKEEPTTPYKKPSHDMTTTNTAAIRVSLITVPSAEDMMAAASGFKERIPLQKEKKKPRKITQPPSSSSDSSFQIIDNTDPNTLFGSLKSREERRKKAFLGSSLNSSRSITRVILLHLLNKQRPQALIQETGTSLTSRVLVMKDEIMDVLSVAQSTKHLAQTFRQTQRLSEKVDVVIGTLSQLGIVDVMTENEHHQTQAYNRHWRVSITLLGFSTYYNKV